jgi:hypothetical protein
MAGKAYNFGGLRVVNDANPPYELYECSIFIHFPRTIVRAGGDGTGEAYLPRPPNNLKKFSVVFSATVSKETFFNKAISSATYRT